MTHRMTSTIGIFVAEEQEFYRNIYESSLSIDDSFNFLGASSNGDEKALIQVLDSEKPNILLLGAKKFNDNLIRELEQVCSVHPKIGIVVLMTHINEPEAKLLRKMLAKCRGGVAIYLKQSLDSTKQLHDIIRSVNRGQIVLDPAVANSILMERVEYPFMKQLTERELEILNLLALGCTNHAIANNLCIDIKTVAHHLNNIYGKLKDDDEPNLKHPRVSVARIYLETTGELMPFNKRSSIPISVS